MGFLRSTANVFFFLLAFIMFLMGVVVLGYMLWVLATTEYGRFLEGVLTFTYVHIGVGAVWFVTGLCGWIGSYKKGGVGMKMFLGLAVIMVAAEVGGIVALSILKIKMIDILKSGWEEVNDPTKNLIQDKFECCGFTGPREFALSDSLIDKTCYRMVDETSDVSIKELRRINRAGCREKLVDFFYKHKVIWIASLGVLLLLQVTGILLSVYLMNAKKREGNSPSLTHRSYTTGY
ncbi:CD82 antigen-like isoform X2 [Ornithodoros turicata]|uniref:CD82 antigen-like isoform X2 n=1 Tax=Ornithodoros turicata TaxID=34597 RepID=UPI0031395225